MKNGWIKTYRELLNWQWHDDSEMMNLWITLLLLANFEEKSWKGTPLKRGQIKTTIKHLSTQTGVSPKKIQNRLNWLSEGGCIEKETTKDYTLITICNYDSYQSEEELKGKQKEDKGILNGETEGKPKENQGELHKKDNKDKNEKNIEKESTLRVPKKNDWRLSTSLPVQERMSALAEQIKPYVKDYGRDMCNDFYRYWITDQGSGVMLFEVTKKYPTFQVASRLATWYRKTSGKERPLPPQVEATLPSLFNDVSSSDDEAKAIEEMIKDMESKFIIRGEDGEMYSTEEDARQQTNSLSARIEIEKRRIINHSK